MKIIKWSKVLLVASLLAPVRQREEYPDRPITGVIAWGAGGGTDTVSRLMTPIAEKILKQSVVLANKTGATGAIAAQAVYTAKADGYTVMFHAENPQLYQVLGLSPLSYDEFEPVILSVQGSTVIVVPKDSPLKTYDDLIKAAKANPGKLSIGISGVGGQPWVTGTLLKKVEGVTFNPVAFDGDGPLVTALLGKQLDVSGLAVGAAAVHQERRLARAGDHEELAEQFAARSALHHQAQSGLYRGHEGLRLLLRRVRQEGHPQPIIDKLTTAYKYALNDSKFVDYAKNNGLEVIGLTGAQARDFMNTWRSQMSWLIYEPAAAGLAGEVRHSEAGRRPGNRAGRKPNRRAAQGIPPPDNRTRSNADGHHPRSQERHHRGAAAGARRRLRARAQGARDHRDLRPGARRPPVPGGGVGGGQQADVHAPGRRWASRRAASATR